MCELVLGIVAGGILSRVGKRAKVFGMHNLKQGSDRDREQVLSRVVDKHLGPLLIDETNPLKRWELSFRTRTNIQIVGAANQTLGECHTTPTLRFCMAQRCFVCTNRMLSHQRRSSEKDWGIKRGHAVYKFPSSHAVCTLKPWIQ